MKTLYGNFLLTIKIIFDLHGATIFPNRRVLFSNIRQ